MVRHVIVWTLKEEYSEDEKAGIKAGGLKDKVPGIVEIRVNTEKLDSSNTDLMLDSLFENEEALKGYAVHPEHVKVANEKVRPYTSIRSCFDYEV